jgi:hypothetical protein
MASDKETFLARWSRLKREPPAEKPAETPAPALPPVETLTPQSDFKDFMHPKVKEELRRLALKKLFTDPHFNLPDPFEPFSGDWTGAEPISPELLATLNQARSVLFNEQEKKPAEPEPEPQVEGEPKQDEPRRQDT